jgi:hypothetical protein
MIGPRRLIAVKYVDLAIKLDIPISHGELCRAPGSSKGQSKTGKEIATMDIA